MEDVRIDTVEKEVIFLKLRWIEAIQPHKLLVDIIEYGCYHGKKWWKFARLVTIVTGAYYPLGHRYCHALIILFYLRVN